MFQYFTITYVVWSITHLAGLSLMLLAAAGLGDMLLHKYRFHSLLERLVFTVTLGLGLYALLLFVVGLFGFLYRSVIWGLTIAGICWAIWLLVRSARSHQDQWRQIIRHWRRYYHPRWFLTIGLLGLGLAYAWLLLVVAQYPPRQWDAIGNHLVLAREYLLRHQVTAVDGIVQPVLLALNHLLFTWALALKDDILAQMVEYALMMLVALGLYAWGKRKKQAALGLALAAFWLAHPLVRHLGAAAQVDMGVTCYVFFGLYALSIFRDSREATWLYLSLALLGMAAGSKMTGLFFLALAMGYSLWACLYLRVNWKMLARGWGIGLLIALPWYGFIAYHTGNPIWPMPFPFSLGIRSNAAVYLYVENKEFFRGEGIPKTFLSFLKLPVYLATQQDSLKGDYRLGYLSVIALWPLTLIVAIWNRSVRWWAGWVLAFTAFWFFTSSYLRYWLPAIPLIGLCLGEGLAEVFGRIWKSRAFQGAIWLTVTLWAMWWSAVDVKSIIKLAGTPPVKVDERKAFLGSSYFGVEYINEHTQMGDTVGIFGGNYVSYYLKPRLAGWLGNIQADSNTNTFMWPVDDEWRRRVKSQNVTWILVQFPGVSPPKEPPFQHPNEPSYELVFAGGQSCVFHRSPLPPDLSADAARLKSLARFGSDSEFWAWFCGSTASLSQPLCSDTNAAYEGYLDNANCGAVDGWVWNMKQPNCPLSVGIYDGDSLLATVLANRIRDDLIMAGKGAGNHGFAYPVPARIKDGKQHTIRVKVTGTDIDLNNTPRVISCSP